MSAAAPVRRIAVPSLGPAEFVSPLWEKHQAGVLPVAFVRDDTWVRYQLEVTDTVPAVEELQFEKAGPRPRLYFDPKQTRAAIVTCGGLCPGLNNVIRSLFLQLHHHYGIAQVLGLRDGFRGLNPACGLDPIVLSSDFVAGIHKEGGTMLGTSRGPHDPAVMVDFLQASRIDILFCVGGDGTQRGAHAIVEEAARRRLRLAVVGIPKTIDNDLLFCEPTFGYHTAIEKASEIIHLAHTEARAGVNGIGLVKVMGRDSGFIACGATLANQEVNFCLIPEQPFALDGFLAALERRMDAREHAVIVVAEGAGQELFAGLPAERDPSGNLKKHDIGPLLKDRIVAYFQGRGKPVDVKYIDPSYILRSQAAGSFDSFLCDQLARRAAHAALAGKTDLIIGRHADTYIHVPISMAIAARKQVDVQGELWSMVLAATGQPAHFGGPAPPE